MFAPRCNSNAWRMPQRTPPLIASHGGRACSSHARRCKLLGLPDAPMRAPRTPSLCLREWKIIHATRRNSPDLIAGGFRTGDCLPLATTQDQSQLLQSARYAGLSNNAISSGAGISKDRAHCKSSSLVIGGDSRFLPCSRRSSTSMGASNTWSSTAAPRARALPWRWSGLAYRLTVMLV
jgi:hypothetical protein